MTRYANKPLSAALKDYIDTLASASDNYEEELYIVQFGTELEAKAKALESENILLKKFVNSQESLSNEFAKVLYNNLGD